VGASAGDDAVSGFIQPLANIFDRFAKRTSVHRDHGATPAAGEFPMIANPIDGLPGLVRALRTRNLHVRIVNWTSGHRMISSHPNDVADKCCGSAALPLHRREQRTRRKTGINLRRVLG
jgi:hypothetical protein